MNSETKSDAKIFVLASDVLTGLKDATLQFGDHNIVVIPICEFEKMTRMQYEVSEEGVIASSNLRYVSDIATPELTKDGVKQENGSILRFATNYEDVEISEGLNLEKGAKRLFKTCIGLINENPKTRVILISGKEEVRTYAKILGIESEDFVSDLMKPVDKQYSGRQTIEITIDSISEFYSNGYISLDAIVSKERPLLPNMYLTINISGDEVMCGRFDGEKIVPLSNERPFELNPLNNGQKMMIDAFMDKEAEIVIVKGPAGTGKTICALAAGLELHAREEYVRVLYLRAAVPIEDYGYLPGTKDEKLHEYFAGARDNLAMLLSKKKRRGKKEKDNIDVYEDGTYFIENGSIKFDGLAFIRGRSIPDNYIILDEVQNIEPKRIKDIITRASKGTKFVLLGDVTQIDKPGLTSKKNALSFVAEGLKGQKSCRIITMESEETTRSELSRLAAELLK